MIIDSHCHLDFPDLYKELDNVIKRANESQVKYLLTICTTLKSFSTIQLIINKYKNVYGTFGIHPHETDKHKEIDAQFIIDSAKKNKKVIGIGETGLDFFYNHSDKKSQIKSFVEHLNAASDLKIPVIVHTRNAETETFDIIKSETKNINTKVLIHCFTGSSDFAKKLVDINCYISVSGIITFKNATKLGDIVSDIPIDNLLIETDSPYLAPLPYRGKPNEPSYIIHTLEKLSFLKNLEKNQVMKKTTENFNKLFNIL